MEETLALPLDEDATQDISTEPTEVSFPPSRHPKHACFLYQEVACSE